METMTKDLIYEMREQEIITNNFLPTKKEIQKSSKDFAVKIIEDGEHNLYEVFAQVVRLKESFSTIETEIKNVLPQEKFESFGLSGLYRSGGATLNYSEDEVYNALKADLDARVELLKLAQKQDVLDTYGNEVPKVSVTQRKSSLAITY